MKFMTVAIIAVSVCSLFATASSLCDSGELISCSLNLADVVVNASVTEIVEATLAFCEGNCSSTAEACTSDSTFGTAAQEIVDACNSSSLGSTCDMGAYFTCSNQYLDAVLNASVNDLAQVVVDFCSSPCYTDTVLPCASDSNLGSSVQGIVEACNNVSVSGSTCNVSAYFTCNEQYLDAISNAALNDFGQVLVEFCTSPCYTDTVQSCISDGNFGSSAQGFVEACNNVSISGSTCNVSAYFTCNEQYLDAIFNAALNDLGQVLVEFCTSPCYTDTVQSCISDGNFGSSAQGFIEACNNISTLPTSPESTCDIVTYNICNAEYLDTISEVNDHGKSLADFCTSSCYIETVQSCDNIKFSVGNFETSPQEIVKACDAIGENNGAASINSAIVTLLLAMFFVGVLFNYC